MDKEDKLQAQEPQKEDDLDVRLKAAERRIKELKVNELERQVQEAEKLAEAAKKAAESISAPETQIKIQAKPVERDPSAVYDSFFEERQKFEEIYGHRQLYNKADPKGFIKCQLVIDKIQIEESHPDWTPEQVKAEIIKTYKNELSLL